MSFRIPLLVVTSVALLFCFACGGGSINGTKTTFTISANVTGLTGTLVLADNGTDNLSITANGSTAFATKIASGSAYAVTVMTQPSGQTCTLGSNASGTATADVSVAVTCVASGTFTIGGTLSGLAPSSSVILQDNAADDLTVSANGTFTFATGLATGTTYLVTVKTQPAGETCTVVNGSGTVATSNITNVAVTCSAGNVTVTIGGTLTGLASGASIVLQNNGGDNLSLSTNQSFTFTTAVTAGSAYNVTILTQPTNQACTVTGGTGTANANVTTVLVTCLNEYFINGTLSGLATGQSVVIADNGAFDTLTLDANGGFQFGRPITAGGTYDVTVTTQPAGQTCTVGNGTGTANATVNNVTVTCSATTFTIGGTLAGLTSGTVTLADNGTFDSLPLSTNGTFTFTKQIAAGGAYAVTVGTQPAGQTCLVTNGTGVANANVTNIAVNCSVTVPLTLSVAVTGLAASTTLSVKDDQNATLTFSVDGTQQFSNTYTSGATYSVTVTAQPTGQLCSLGPNSSGTITANVIVTATCSASGNTFTIGGTLYDLSPNPSTTGTVLQNNTADNLTLTSNGAFVFATSVANGATYDVSVFTQPTTPDQNCTVLNGTGTAAANVTNVQVVCISEWTWVFGANTVRQGGIYTTPPLDPGSRWGASTWIDGSGNLWLFGGFGYDITGPLGAESVLNDLWEFTGGAWVWVAGSNSNGATGIYPASPGGTGTPGARSNAVSWIDSSGELWLFGGYGIDSLGLNADGLNDLWKFSGGQWFWEGGSNLAAQGGTYLAKGTPGGTPGGRYWSSGSLDAAGNFWMFGGLAYDVNKAQGSMNDLWKFDGTNWTWVSGSSSNGQQGIYTGGGAVPGGRTGQNSWIDSAGNFWVFGGNAIDSANNTGDMNDLWSFPIAGNTWTFVGGSTTFGAGGTYGTQGIPDVGNTPGGREFSTSWLTPSGDLWLLGGERLGGGLYNDVWKYSNGQWSWMDGSQSVSQLGVYPAQTGPPPSPTNEPGSRREGVSWTDSNGNLWLFGGYGLGSLPAGTGTHNGFESLQDLWEFQP